MVASAPTSHKLEASDRMDGSRTRRTLTWFCTLLTSSFSALMAPMSMLFEMLSRWPRNLSHGPAIEMWSVVHLPFACSVKEGKK